MLNRFFILLIPIILSGCSSPKYTAIPIQDQIQSKEITIIKDNPTRAVFLDTMKEWCLDNGHKCKVVSDGTPPVDDELTLTYRARWGWDLRPYIGDAKIKAYRQDKKVGNVEFRASNNMNYDKLGDNKKRIMTMMDLLFGKQKVYEAQSKIKSGKI